jgi:membrane protein implicated in regulation of membrane protease activity
MAILWWHWLVLGLLLVLAEMATAGGFYIIFFGIAAVIVGLLAGAGLAGSVSMQLLLFTVLAVGSLLLFRTRLLRWMQLEPQGPAVDSLVGDIGLVAHDMAPGEVGKIELRGANWSARNAGPDLLRAGSRCRVLRVDGLMLHVGPEGAR